MAKRPGKKRQRVNAENPRNIGLIRLAEVLPQLVAKYGLHQSGHLEKIAGAWKEAIGPPYATVTTVERLNRGVLEVSVPHNAFIQELSFRQTQLLEELRSKLADVKIKKIKFIVRDRHG